MMHKEDFEMDPEQEAAALRAEIAAMQQELLKVLAKKHQFNPKADPALHWRKDIVMLRQEIVVIHFGIREWDTDEDLPPIMQGYQRVRICAYYSPTLDSFCVTVVDVPAVTVFPPTA